MALGVNKVTLIGNLGRDPETHNTPNGLKITTLSLGTNERRKRGNRWEDHVEWHRVVLFGKTAETAEQYLRKGSLIYVEGKLSTNQWQDKDGNKRYTTEIAVNEMRMLDGPSRSSERQREDRRDTRDYGRTEPAGGALPSEDYGDDIPF